MKIYSYFALMTSTCAFYNIFYFHFVFRSKCKKPIFLVTFGHQNKSGNGIYVINLNIKTKMFKKDLLNKKFEENKNVPLECWTVFHKLETFLLSPSRQINNK